MTMTREDARKELTDLITDAINADNLANGRNTLIRYDAGDSSRPDVTFTWVRIVVSHDALNKQTLGPVGGRRFEEAGQLIVQLFTPFTTGTVLSDVMSQVLLGAIRSYSGAIRLTRSSARDIGRSEGWMQVNVLANFYYDTRG